MSPPPDAPNPGDPQRAVKLSVRDLTIRYGETTALAGASFDVLENEIFGIIGPANSGKTSLLRVLNRMDTFNAGMSWQGQVHFDGQDLRTWRNLYALRRRIGVVFPLPVGLPMSIYENVALSPRLRGIKSKAELDVIVERCLTRAALWDEVKDRLERSGASLSGGQQQRLCIARAIAVEPEVLLMDEPCSALDPISTLAIEDLVSELKERFTVVIVTHNMQQAARVSDQTAFFNLKAQGEPGRLVEIDTTERIFSNPKEKATEDYISGRFG